MPLRAMRRSTCSSAAAQASRRAGGGRLLAGDAQGPALVGVVDVPDPGERGLVALDQRRHIAADPVGRGALARHHGDLSRAGFVVEIGDELAEHFRRRAVDRFKGDGRRRTRRRWQGSAGRSSGNDEQPAALAASAATASTPIGRDRYRRDAPHARTNCTPLHQRSPACRRLFCDPDGGLRNELVTVFPAAVHPTGLGHLVVRLP